MKRGPRHHRVREPGEPARVFQLGFKRRRRRLGGFVVRGIRRALRGHLNEQRVPPVIGGYFLRLRRKRVSLEYGCTVWTNSALVMYL